MEGICLGWTYAASTNKNNRAEPERTFQVVKIVVRMMAVHVNLAELVAENRCHGETQTNFSGWRAIAPLQFVGSCMFVSLSDMLSHWLIHRPNKHVSCSHLYVLIQKSRGCTIDMSTSSDMSEGMLLHTISYS